MLPILIFAGLTIAQSSGEAQSSQTFVSAPELHAPVLSVNKSGAQLANGLLLMTSQEYGPLLMTDFGDLIWNGPSGHATNLFVQYLDDDPVLTYWIGTGSNLEHGYGQVNILDTNYDQIYTICPNLTLTTTMGQSTGCGLDLHESLLTTRGTIICTAVNVTTADLTSVGGPQVGWVYDNLFLEINIKTNDILFVWSALASGIPINSTKQALSSAGTSQSNPFDWFHMNSVTTLNDGYLANSRHAWSSYALDSNGRVKWTLEGSNGGDFALPTVANFVSLGYLYDAHPTQPITHLVLQQSNTYTSVVLAASCSSGERDFEFPFTALVQRHECIRRHTFKWPTTIPGS